MSASKMGKKSERELAYIHDLYISPDWGERFAELFDEHIVLPEKGRALYIGMGTGSHALSLRQRASKEIAFTFIDESEERLEIARAKANAVKMEDSSSFSASQLDSLKFEDGSFDLVIGDLSLHPPERIPAVLSEMVRVAAKRGQVALLCTAASSFGEFFSIYWEAITNAELDEHTQVVENLIVEQPTISDLEQLGSSHGLKNVESWTNKEEFDYASGQAFLSSPLIADFFMTRWLEPLPTDQARNKVTEQISNLIDEECQDIEFALSIKATLLAGIKR